MIVVIGGYLQKYLTRVCVYFLYVFFFCVLSELAKMRSTAKLPVDCLSAVNPGCVCLLHYVDVLLVSKSTQ
jgi:hypothetical protein